MRYCIANGEEKMRGFVYRSTKVLPFGNLWVKFTTNPKIAETLGGVLTCRSSYDVHPIPSLLKNLAAQKKHLNTSVQFSSPSSSSLYI